MFHGKMLVNQRVRYHGHTVDACEILHQLVDGLSHYDPIILTVFHRYLIVPNWWRISCIHSIFQDWAPRQVRVQLPKDSG